jgi:hypothetical protein
LVFLLWRGASANKPTKYVTVTVDPCDAGREYLSAFFKQDRSVEVNRVWGGC